MDKYLNIRPGTRGVNGQLTGNLRGIFVTHFSLCYPFPHSRGSVIDTESYVEFAGNWRGIVPLGG